MNSFGKIFRISIYGESHSTGVGVIIDGCPPGVPIKPEMFTEDLKKRQGGKKGTTPRKESDIPEIISGVFNDYSTGTPLHIYFPNKNIDSSDYEQIKNVPRPGHADFVAQKKYKGFNDHRGGGHFSGRLTVGLTAAGVIAKKILNPVKITAALIEAGGMKDIDKAIERTEKENDSIGGIIECKVLNVPIGWGEPFFTSVESHISSIIFSIPGIKGIEFGAGFAGCKMPGSKFNDPIIDNQGTTLSNNAGGINGGITNGNPIIFRVAVKPPSSIRQTQTAFDLSTERQTELNIKGRHDVCFALRTPPVIEAVTAIALTDLYLLSQSVS